MYIPPKMARPRRQCVMTHVKPRRAIVGLCPNPAVWQPRRCRKTIVEKIDVCNMKWSFWWQLASFLAFLLTVDVFPSSEGLVLNSEHTQPPRPSKAPEGLLASVAHTLELGISRRAFKNIDALGPGWVGHIVYSDAIYPYRIGVQILGKFYRAIMLSASGIWVDIPRMNTFVIYIGTIRLWIWSEDPLARITWDFVHDFASRMLTATQLGFMALFDGSFVHMASGVMVHTKLVILGRNPPAN